MYRKLAEAIKDSQNIVFFSGAGMSVDSGIPDFRSSNGLYNNVYRAEEMISHSFFMNNTEEFYPFYKDKLCYPDALPNYGHLFIAKLQENKNVTVVTQNIDGLDNKANIKKVYELHGSIHRNYCMKCHKFYGLNKILESNNIPRCECGGIIKPDVVLYEEGLDETTISNSIKAISNADLMIILGTSLSVYPAASFVRYFRGKTLAIINKSCTNQDKYADIVIHDDIVQTFKNIDQILKEM